MKRLEKWIVLTGLCMIFMTGCASAAKEVEDVPNLTNQQNTKVINTISGQEESTVVESNVNIIEETNAYIIEDTEIFKDADSSSSVVGSANNGEKIIITGVSKDAAYYQILFENEEGYVLVEKVSSDNPNDTSLDTQTVEEVKDKSIEVVKQSTSSKESEVKQESEVISDITQTQAPTVEEIPSQVTEPKVQGDKWVPYLDGNDMTQEGYDIANATWTDDDWNNFYAWQDSVWESKVGVDNELTSQLLASVLKNCTGNPEVTANAIAEYNAMHGYTDSNGECCAYGQSSTNTDEIVQRMKNQFPNYFENMKQIGVCAYNTGVSYTYVIIRDY